jgi:hypothetical protein
MDEEKLKKGGFGCLIIILIVITIAQPILGIFLFAIAFGGWVLFRYLKSDNLTKRNNQIIQKYGKENGTAILTKRLMIGMSKEMVQLTKGRPDYVKKTEKVGERTEKWYWGKYEVRKTTKYRTYGILVNDELTEFGDL